MAETLLCSLMLWAPGSAGRAVGSVPWAIPRSWISTDTHCLLAPAHLGYWDLLWPRQQTNPLTQVSQEKIRLMVCVQNLFHEPK